MSEISEENDKIKRLAVQTGRQLFGLVNKFEAEMMNIDMSINQLMFDEEEFSVRLFENVKTREEITDDEHDSII
jgi:hypothetical protein